MIFCVLGLHENPVKIETERWKAWNRSLTLQKCHGTFTADVPVQPVDVPVS